MSFPPKPRRAKTLLSTGKAAHCLVRPAGRPPCLARGTYTGVREHDKGPRTQLADVFNILLKNGVNLFGWPRQNGTLSFFCKGTLNQIGMFQHEVDQLILTHICIF